MTPYFSQLNGSTLFENRRVQVETTWNMTSLLVSRAERQDAGQYSLTLENNYGSSTLNVEVIVIGM